MFDQQVDMVEYKGRASFTVFVKSAVDFQPKFYIYILKPPFVLHFHPPRLGPEL
jgi:hypothetical protein